jgi:hypothetical protein
MKSILLLVFLFVLVFTQSSNLDHETLANYHLNLAKHHLSLAKTSNSAHQNLAKTNEASTLSWCYDSYWGWFYC